MPAWVPTIFTFAAVYATDMRIVSKRPTTKHANEHTNGTRPARARPAATPMAFCSAMPRLKARSGNFLAKATVMVDFDRSASSVTIRSSFAPSSTRASPNAARVAFPGIVSPHSVGGFQRRATAAPGRAERGGFGGHVGAPMSFTSAQLLDERAGARIGGQVTLPVGLGDAEDLANCCDGLGRLRRLAVPLGIVLHEGHALALHRVGYDEEGLVACGLGLVQRLVDLVDLVTVYLEHGPAERLPLGDHGLDILDLRHEVVELDLVVVEDDGEVVEGVVGPGEAWGRHGRVPPL